MRLPAGMRVMRGDGEGREARLAPDHMPLPVPGTGQILIRNHAIGLNRADLLQLRGLYPPPDDASPLLGLEVAGEVAALGEGVTRWRIGDRVAALTAGGGYADYTLADAEHAFPLPGHLSWTEGAALAEALFTATEALHVRARLQPGESLFLHGISGGIGTIATQIARQVWGVGTVLASVSSPAKAEHAERLGATPIDYRQSDIAEEVLRQTAGRGADVILDMVGGPAVNGHFRMAALDGRIVSIALQGGSKSEIHMPPLLTRRLCWQGLTIRALPKRQKDHTAAIIRQSIWPKIEKGEIFAVIDRVFPLKDATDAHAYMSTGMHVGKIILMP